MIMEQLHGIYEYFLSTLTAQLSMGGGGKQSVSHHISLKGCHIRQVGFVLVVEISFFTKNGGAA